MSDERQHDKGPSARGPGDRVKWRRDLILFGALLLTAFALYLWDRDNTSENNRAAIIDGIIANCEVNRDQDAENQRLVALFVGMAKQNLRERERIPPDQLKRSRDFLREFGDTEPPTDCEQQRENIEDALQ